MSLVAVESVLN